MEEEELEVGCVASFSGEEEDESSNYSDDVGSFVEREEGLREDDTSSSSSMCSFRASTSSSSSSNDTAVEEGPLFEMSSLMSILPIKRGLSKHYDGKSQSFASLSDVSCLEDLAKSRKKLKSSRSCPGGFPDVHRPLSVTVSSRAITKKAPRWSSISPSLRSPRRHRLSNRNPPVPLQRPVSPSDRPSLFSSRSSACNEGSTWS